MPQAGIKPAPSLHWFLRSQSSLAWSYLIFAPWSKKPSSEHTHTHRHWYLYIYTRTGARSKWAPQAGSSFVAGASTPKCNQTKWELTERHSAAKAPNPSRLPSTIPPAGQWLCCSCLDWILWSCFMSNRRLNWLKSNPYRSGRVRPSYIRCVILLILHLDLQSLVSRWWTQSNNNSYEITLMSPPVAY